MMKQQRLHHLQFSPLFVPFGYSDMKYILASTLILILIGMYSVTFGANDCSKITIDGTFKAKTKAEKNSQLEQKIWQDIKRNETPDWNPSIVTAEEMTKAYADLANQKNAIEKANLFNGLRDKATAEGVICKI